MLHWHAVWLQMRKLTHLHIEKLAISELISYIEKHANSVIYQSIAELEKANELKKIQGLYPKSRIDKECIKNAIKTINSKDYSPPSKKDRRQIKKNNI